ncbi:MAG: type 1 glutamine amidotransferase, partial [Proteobacteria bacterium]|nr:type 1 glutamine amidotransferase [Pseudomonadota bacterium]
MKIGILQTGRAPEALVKEHGDYDKMFIELLSDPRFSFNNFPVLDSVFPKISDYDGYIITGSRFGVYENYPWISQLEDFIRACFESDIPVAGFCFGHQIMAQALGGKVEKFDGGWAVGVENYQIQGDTVSLLAWHQDQVITPPDNSKTIASSDFCKFAGLTYGKKGFSLQAHPEFNTDFVKGLMSVRGETL